MADIAKKDNIATTSLWYDSVKPKWDMVDTLLKGTPGMRAARDRYTPKHDKEEDSTYDLRLEITFLLEAYLDAIDRAVALPFSVPLKVDGLPPELEYLVDNVDNLGTSMNSYAELLLNKSINYGMDFLFADYPQTKNSNGAIITNAKQERDLGINPRILRIDAPDMLFIRVSYNLGVPTLTEVRFREWRTEPCGTYGEQSVEYIRVVGVDYFELWKKIVKEGTVTDEWEKADEGAHDFGSIPIIPFYTNKKGFFRATPPLEKLAQKNVEHWQKDSQKNIELYYASGVWYETGAEVDKNGTPLTPLVVGPGIYRATSSPEGALTHVAPDPAALEKLFEDLANIVREMKEFGAAPFQDNSVAITATAEAGSITRQTSDIKAWTTDEEDALEMIIRFCARWKKIEHKIGKDLNVNIHHDYQPLIYGSTDLDHVEFAINNGMITKEQGNLEFQRRSVLSENMDAKKQVTLAAKEMADSIELIPIRDPAEDVVEDE